MLVSRVKVESLALRATLKADTQAAEAESNLKGQELAVAREKHDGLRKGLAKIYREQSAKAMKPEYVEEPSTPDLANAVQATFQSKLTGKMEAETFASAEAQTHKAKMIECDNGIETRASLREDLDELKVGEGETPNITLPQDDHGLKARIRAIRHEVGEAEKNLKAGQERLDEHFDGIQTILREADDPGSENAIKIKLKDVPREALIRGAAGIRDSATARRTIIEKDLEAIGQDRQVIVTELDIVVQEARSLLHSAERVSRLPEKMTGWAGLPFLRIKLPDLSPADVNLKPWFESMSDSQIQIQKPSPPNTAMATRFPASRTRVDEYCKL